MKPRMLGFLLPLAVFAALAAFLAKGLQRDPNDLPSPLIGRAAPAFDAPLVADGGKRLRAADMLGKVWVLNVWASWCVACRAEHEVVRAFAGSTPVPVIGLNYKDRPDAARRWLQRLGDPYAASLHDPEGRIGIDWGVYGVPETFVVDREGIVRLKITGPLTDELLRTRVEPLLRALHG
jgi:cytochrome c biogenesis protein CcmG/thiol:disulfide interchange protein DsbE